MEEGVAAVEVDNQDQYYVGFGGFPNAAGVMELDAAIMDGTRQCVRPCVVRVGSDLAFRLTPTQTQHNSNLTTTQHIWCGGGATGLHSGRVGGAQGEIDKQPNIPIQRKTDTYLSSLSNQSRLGDGALAALGAGGTGRLHLCAGAGKGVCGGGVSYCNHHPSC